MQGLFDVLPIENYITFEDSRSKKLTLCGKSNFFPPCGKLRVSDQASASG
jgi:hypothetical protein